jgi:hypothetical protein
MVYSDGNSAGAEEYATTSIVNLMSAHMKMYDGKYIITLEDGSGGLQKRTVLKFITSASFSFQDGSPTLSSPIMFRLAEMYLNRAEANAKDR